MGFPPSNSKMITAAAHLLYLWRTGINIYTFFHGSFSHHSVLPFRSFLHLDICRGYETVYVFIGGLLRAAFLALLLALFGSVMTRRAKTWPPFFQRVFFSWWVSNKQKCISSFLLCIPQSSECVLNRNDDT